MRRRALPCCALTPPCKRLPQGSCLHRGHLQRSSKPYSFLRHMRCCFARWRCVSMRSNSTANSLKHVSSNCWPRYACDTLHVCGASVILRGPDKGWAMLKKHRQFFESLLFLFDLSMIAAAWLGAYGLRFGGWPLPVYHDIPPLREYLFLGVFILPIWGAIFKGMQLYRPRRVSSHLREAGDILKASTLATLVLMVTAYFLKEPEFSRVVFVYFWGLSSMGLVCSRLIFRELLRVVRRRGYNLRHILIVGTEHVGQTLRQQIGQHPELGLRIVGFLTRYQHEIGQRLDGIEILGHIDQVQVIVRTARVDQVFIALPLEAQGSMEKIVRELGNEMVDINVVPDLYQYAILRGSVEESEGLPIITLSGSPMYGWNSIMKRAFDVCLGVPALFLSFPVLALVAGLVKLTSRGPVFYVQERMGFDGTIFRIVKFRTMRDDAERETGAVWAQENDPRRTS